MKQNLLALLYLGLFIIGFGLLFYLLYYMLFVSFGAGQ